MTAITVEASNAQPSACMDEDAGAVDVSVTVTIDGREIDGEVTLLPDPARGRLGSWGAVDNWVSPGLLRELRALDQEGWAKAIAEIESAAVEAAS